VTSYLHEVARRLVAYDTVSAKSNADAAGYLADELARHGFRVACQEYEARGVRKVNVVATAGPPVAGGLILSGHVDVVPFAGQAGWTRDPLALVVEDDRVYGRGTADMKGFVAQCLAVAAELDRAALRRPLVFLFTADEEIGCRGAHRLVPELARLLGDVPTPALAWIGEPTSWRIFHTHKGIVVFTITAHGIAGHSSLPERGQNAIAVVAKVIACIGAYQAELRAAGPTATSAIDYPECPYTPMNLGTVHGGTADNMIPDRCVLTVSYRPLPEDDPRAVHREIARRLAVLDLSDPGAPGLPGRIDVGEPSVVAGMRSPRGTALESALAEALDAGDAAGGGAPFATDGGEFERGAIASLICGPGELEQAHQPNESVARAAFEGGVATIRSVVRRLSEKGF
jgi:acetylornithine deacetylase